MYYDVYVVALWVAGDIIAGLTRTVHRSSLREWHVFWRAGPSVAARQSKDPELLRQLRPDAKSKR